MATFSQGTNWIEAAESQFEASKEIRDKFDLGLEVSTAEVLSQIRELVHINGGLGCQIANGQLITKSETYAKAVEDEVGLLVTAVIKAAEAHGERGF